MKIVIPGGSGEIGTILARALTTQGEDVVVLSRRPYSAPWRVAEWDGATVGEWIREIDGADVVINLAGRSVNCRYTATNRKQILDSRILSTRAVGQAIASAKSPPRVWLQMSTATIYAHRYDAPNDERTGVIGGGEPGAPETWRFSIDVARGWEAEANNANVPRTRRVLMRSAIVMSPCRGGTFAFLCRLVRFGLGGKDGDGRQYVSWVHHADFVRAVSWLIGREELSGPVNIASPNPLPNAEFKAGLKRALGMPIAFPAMNWMLELGTFSFRSETELVLKSRRVIPTRLLESGFGFRYPTWPEAALDLVNRKSS